MATVSFYAPGVSVRGYRQLDVVAGRAVLSLIAGKTAQGNTLGPGGAQSPWTANDYDTVTPSAVRNAGFFAADVDLSALTCATLHEGVGDYRHPGVLVTPRHIFAAAHYPPGYTAADPSGSPVGSTVSFKRADGTYQTATILSAARTSVAGLKDHWIGYLSEPITGIVPMQIMFPGWEDYLFSPFPVLIKNIHTPDGTDDDRVSVIGIDRLDAPAGYTFVYFDAPTGDALDWYSAPAFNDSGSPVMALIDGSPVLLCCLLNGAGGYSVSHDLDAINGFLSQTAAAAGDNSAYSLRVLSSSGFSRRA